MVDNWLHFRNLAKRSKAEGNLGESISYLESGLRCPDAEAAPPGDIALMRNGLAELYYQTGNYNCAEENARESLKLELEFGDKGAETTKLADYLMMLSKILEKEGRFAEAIKSVDAALQIFSDLMGEGNAYVNGVKSYGDYIRANVWRG